MIRINRGAGLQHELDRGKDELSARFRRAPSRTLRAGKVLTTVARASDVAYRLQAGWACQFRDLSDGCRAIVDVYLPGDVIGLDPALSTRPVENVLALTSIAVEAIDAEDDDDELMTSPSTALYVAWLLGQRQRRTDCLLTAISCLDARGRLATMVLDFYRRLGAQASIFNLPLTQHHIGSYLGLTVVHVNRVLRSLRDDRIVQLERHCVTIIDLEGLMKLAQDGRSARAAGGVEGWSPEAAARLAS